MKIFKELRINYGILVSEKDSIIFPQSLAPELYEINDRCRQIHHIKDYTGKTKEEKLMCIKQIIDICHEHKYTHIFAGYGFMAEDHEFVEKIENSNLKFVGPNSKVIKKAGSKDEAKKLARSLKIPVIPGEDNIAAKTLLRKAGRNAIVYFHKQIKKYKLILPKNWESMELINQANEILLASYSRRIDLFSISDLQKESSKIVKKLLEDNPGKRIRFKHVLGGGGKGQRVISSVKEVPEAVMSILIESKTNGVGDNKNFLIEINIENSRHIEIQLLGNGDWCIELGGRDCSIQMHEQKLVEVSLTEEMLNFAAKEYESSKKKSQANVLKKDAKILQSMLLKAKNFGKALNLDSVSTFECILDKDKLYFMEVNTRIQVEHRVTEMAYKLRFTNPENHKDTFEVNSLVATMILINCYSEKLQFPERISRSISGVEARINATNLALNPQAGGIVKEWSLPIKDETRDDQGISAVNQFTGRMQPYNLTGAYDSNVALCITEGSSQKKSFEKLTEIFRQMDVSGQDLHLNIEFIYGILNWILGNDPMFKPNTNFVSSYLALTGKIKELSDQINFEVAWSFLVNEAKSKYGEIGTQICEKKLTLLLRPLKILFCSPHLMMGWLAFKKYKFKNKELIEIENPIKILKKLYYFLNLDQEPNKVPSKKIWNHDQKLLEKATKFYEDLGKKLGKSDIAWQELSSLLKSEKTPANFNFCKNSKLWENILATHNGHQLAMELLKLPEFLAEEAGYFNFRVNNSLEIEIPQEFIDVESKNIHIAKLSLSQTTSSNKILAWSGGIFYSRESPDSGDYVIEGQYVKEGQVLGLLEVMKMFNKIQAEFSGIIKKKCIETSSGSQVSKGQTLFLIEPDEKPKTHSKKHIYENQKKQTNIFMQKIFSSN